MGKIKPKTPLIKTKLAESFDWEGELDIPNPYRDKGKTGYKGSTKLLNLRERKDYNKIKDLLRVLDLEYMLGKDKKKKTKKKNKNTGGKVSEGTKYVAKLYGGIVGK